MPRPEVHTSTLTADDRQQSEPLLNDEQRAALTAALAKKRAEQPMPTLLANGTSSDADASTGGSAKPHMGKNPHNEGMKTKRDLAHDHHLTRKGKGSGKTKKSGAGGKFTWGRVIDGEEAAEGAIDRNDPNYDSDLEEGISFAEERATQIVAYKRTITSMLQEYFDSGDLNEAAVSLQELDHPDFGHYFIKRAITTALDRHDREREMTSVLLSTLYNEVISPDQMKKGFAEVIIALEDTKLDVPDAIDLVALFVCRAIADDVLPPAFVTRLSGVEGSPVSELQHKCEAHLKDQHFAERMNRAWGLGAGIKLEETKSSIASMLKEYSSAGDASEVRRLLHDLAVPFFHHELVKQALLAGMEAGDMTHMLSLLGELSSSGDISTSQMTKGYQRVADNLDDTELDNPSARSLFDQAVTAATAGNWLEEGWTPSPTSLSIPGTPGSLAAAGINGGTGTNLGPFHPDVATFKGAALGIVREYFDSGDVEEVARSLAELDEPGFHNIFVKHGVQLSLDRKDREREMMSALLPNLHPSLISDDQVSLGFTRLLAGADDLALDIPECCHLLALFLARAVMDEVLPPRFLAEVVPQLNNGSLGVEIVQQAGGMLTARHAGERLASCWHARADAEALGASIADIVKEFIASGDKGEAARCLNDLGAPHFHHEMTYQALVAAMSEGEESKVPERVLGLLRQLAESGEVNQTQMRMGFDRVKDDLDDLTLDIVKAQELFPVYEASAVKEGWLVAADDDE